MILQTVKRQPLQRTLPPLTRNMSSIVRARPLSAPAVFVGTVDATRDRFGSMPRTVEQAFGPGVSSDTVRYPESCDAAATRAHNITTAISIAIGVVTLIGLIAGRIFA